LNFNSAEGRLLGIVRGKKVDGIPSPFSWLGLNIPEEKLGVPIFKADNHDVDFEGDGSKLIIHVPPPFLVKQHFGFLESAKNKSFDFLDKVKAA